MERRTEHDRQGSQPPPPGAAGVAPGTLGVVGGQGAPPPGSENSDLGSAIAEPTLQDLGAQADALLAEYIAERQAATSKALRAWKGEP